MRRRPELLPALAAGLVLLTACGGGGGGGPTVPPPPPNDPPSIEAPAGLGGSGVLRTFTLATGSTDQLVFTATDPDGDALQWQMQAPGAAAAGLTFTTPVSGGTFTLDLGTCAAPVAVNANLLVQDPNGGAFAIDLLIVRSGAPTITGCSPDSAFATRPQKVTVTGTALQLGGSVQTVAQFDGATAGANTIVDDRTLTCTTPASATPGPTFVSVTHLFGTAQLPDTDFTMYAFPPAFTAADAQLDAGNATAFQVARDGAAVHAVWLEGTSVVHRVSTDAGATWAAAQTLSGGEVGSEPQVAVAGDDVTVLWIGDGNSVQSRRSHDAGASFAAAQVLDTSGDPVQNPRLVATGVRRYAAWQRGSVGAGTARIVVTASADAGDTWRTAALIGDGGARQTDAQVVGDGAVAIVTWIDERLGASVPGVYTARTSTGGITWGPPQRRSLTTTAASTPRLCADAGVAWLLWLRADVLEFMGSADMGIAWPTVPGELHGGGTGAVTEPALACEGNRLYAAYVLAGSSVEFTVVGGIGTQPQNVTLSAATGPAGEPRLACRGNYVFAAWRDGAVSGGAARIVQTTSVDLGAHFEAPLGLGDGTAAQEQPQLQIDGARELLMWRDHRTTPAGIFTNRTP